MELWSLYLYNHGRNCVEKFTKLSKIDAFFEIFRVDLKKFFSITVEIWLLVGHLWTCSQLKAFQGFS